jgi:FkbM family methyltransferase
MNPIRRIGETLARGRVFRRRLPLEYGGALLYVTPECGLRYLKPTMKSVDPGLLNLAKELVKPGHVVWDIGANLGLFTFAAAGLAGASGHVFAIEPDTYLVGLLRKSSHLGNQHAAPVSVIACAVADSLSLANFRIAQRARASNSLAGHGASQSGGTREIQHVLTITLDWLATQVLAPDVIKIDAEGADLLVLRGAQQVLRKSQPLLMLEVYDDIADEVTSLLLNLGYTMLNADLSTASRQPLDRAVFSTLAIPNPKLQT